MTGWNISSRAILIYRIVFVGLSWFTMMANALISFEYFIFTFISYTMQTNLMVSVWWTLAIIWHNNPEKLKKLSGVLKGAFTLYITVTFVIFALLLSMYYQPTGFAAFMNLIVHYIIPIAFIIDWILTEREIKYEWRYLLYFLSYPLCYLVFAEIYGTFTGNYLYYFLDLNASGITGFIFYIIFLVTFFIAVGCLYIAINRKRMNE